MKLRASLGRKATTLVETAAVISVMFLFLFGVYEYGRYTAMLQVVENAARDGARMAVAHTADKQTSDIVANVMDKLGGMDYQLSNLQVTIGAQILVPQNSSETAGQALPDWTQTSNTDGVVVTITADYAPIVPTFLQMPVTIPINSTSIMYSEGN